MKSAMVVQCFHCGTQLQIRDIAPGFPMSSVIVSTGDYAVDVPTWQINILPDHDCNPPRPMKQMETE